MSKEEETMKKERPPKIALGFYRHFKTQDAYEVIEIAENCNNYPDEYCGLVVVYRNVKTRKVYSRDMLEFVELLGQDVPRFKLDTVLDTPLQLLITTIRMCRLEYLRMCLANPLFVQNRANQSFLYMLGDKIAFAQATRIISTKHANNLIQWLNTWSDRPTTSNEKQRIFGDKEEGQA
jgi:hypothetical protein